MTDPTANTVATIHFIAAGQVKTIWPTAALGRGLTKRVDADASRAAPDYSKLGALLEGEPQLSHAGSAPGVPPGGVRAARRKDAVDGCLALFVGLLVGHLFRGRSVGDPKEQKHSSGQQSTDLPVS